MWMRRRSTSRLGHADILNARALDMDTLAKLLDLDLEEEDADTLGGLITAGWLCARAGETVDLEEWRLRGRVAGWPAHQPGARLTDLRSRPRRKPSNRSPHASVPTLRSTVRALIPPTCRTQA